MRSVLVEGLRVVVSGVLDLGEATDVGSVLGELNIFFQVIVLCQVKVLLFGDLVQVPFVEEIVGGCVAPVRPEHHVVHGTHHQVKRL